MTVTRSPKTFIEIYLQVGTEFSKMFSNFISMKKSDQPYYLFYEFKTLRQVLYSNRMELLLSEDVNDDMLDYHFESCGLQLMVTPQYAVKRMVL